jgi:hypothetical protein
MPVPNFGAGTVLGAGPVEQIDGLWQQGFDGMNCSAAS